MEGFLCIQVVWYIMAISIEIPENWSVDNESDEEVSVEGDTIAFLNESNGLSCRVSGVKEVSDRLDFLGEIIDENGDELDSLWLASDDFGTVAHTRDEMFEWAEGQMKSYAYY